MQSASSRCTPDKSTLLSVFKGAQCYWLNCVLGYTHTEGETMAHNVEDYRLGLLVVHSLNISVICEVRKSY